MVYSARDEAGEGGGLREGRKGSFLKKRTKKLLDFGVRGPASVQTHEKSFLVLFFKKEQLSSV
jgi:hypothetical protein